VDLGGAIYGLIKKHEMGGTCSTYGEQERCTQGFGGKEMI
jgi:hypothetical protein